MQIRAVSICRLTASPETCSLKEANRKSKESVSLKTEFWEEESQ